MNKKNRVLLIVKNYTQRQLYHEFLVNSGYSVYLCDELSHGLTQLIMSKKTNAIILDTNYPDNSVIHFIKTINNHYQWSKIPVLMVDSAEKGDSVRNAINKRPFRYTLSIDPLEIIDLLKEIL